jgi:hypothetical protein
MMDMLQSCDTLKVRRFGQFLLLFNPENQKMVTSFSNNRIPQLSCSEPISIFSLMQDLPETIRQILEAHDLPRHLKED